MPAPPQTPLEQLQAAAADLYATARSTRVEFPEASALYADRAAALSLAARVLAGVEDSSDISAGAAMQHAPRAADARALRAELDSARSALRHMSTNEGRLHLQIARLETELRLGGAPSRKV